MLVLKERNRKRGLSSIIATPSILPVDGTENMPFLRERRKRLDETRAIQNILIEHIVSSWFMIVK
jgi:hypothetical protein